MSEKSFLYPGVYRFRTPDEMFGNPVAGQIKKDAEQFRREFNTPEEFDYADGSGSRGVAHKYEDSGTFIVLTTDEVERRLTEREGE